MAIGRVIANLSDTVGNYGIMVQRAQVAVERANLTYEQSVLQLDNTVTNARHALDQARNNHEIAQQRIKQQVQQAQLQLNQTQLSGDSATALEIEKLQTDVDNQLDNLKNSFQINHIQAVQLQKNIFEIANQMLGITALYESQALNYQSKLGIQKPGLRQQAKSDAAQFMQREETLQQMKPNPTTDTTLRKQLNQLDTFYAQTDMMLSTLDDLVQFSLTSNT